MGWEQNMMRAAAEKLAADNPQGSVARGRGINNQFVPVPSLEQTNDISNNLIAANNRAAATKSAMGTDSGAGLTSSTTSGGKSQMAADLSALIDAQSLNTYNPVNKRVGGSLSGDILRGSLDTISGTNQKSRGDNQLTMGGLESAALDAANETRGPIVSPGGPDGTYTDGQDDLLRRIDDNDDTGDYLNEVPFEPPVETVDLFGDQADLINEQLGGLSTADFTADIKALMAEAEKGAKAVTTQQIKDIAASYGVASGNIDAVAKAATTALNAQESKRKAVQAEVGTIASNQITAMLDRQEADVAAGQALLGENLTSEFAEVVQLTNALINSQAVSAQSSMGRIQAIGNMAAAQRLAAPALMMADAKNALGDERFRLEGQAQAALVKTLNSLSIQEKELVLAEAQRIESFNNNRDAALAQALVNNGMAKLQNTIEEQRLAVASASRASELAASRQASADAAVESRRRWEAEFGLKKSEAASTQAARLAQTNAAERSADAEATSDYSRAVVVAQMAYGPDASSDAVNRILAMSPTMQNSLMSKAVDQIDEAFSASEPASFEALRKDGYSPDVATNAIIFVKNAQKITALQTQIAFSEGYSAKAKTDQMLVLEAANEELKKKYPSKGSTVTTGTSMVVLNPDVSPLRNFESAINRIQQQEKYTATYLPEEENPAMAARTGNLQGFTDYTQRTSTDNRTFLFN